MKKIVILFPEREITFTDEAPEVITNLGRKITGIRVAGQKVREFLAYIDWPRVRAVLFYDVQIEQEDEEHGT